MTEPNDGTYSYHTAKDHPNYPKSSTPIIVTATNSLPLSNNAAAPTTTVTQQQEQKIVAKIISPHAFPNSSKIQRIFPCDLLVILTTTCKQQQIPLLDTALKNYLLPSVPLTIVKLDNLETMPAFFEAFGNRILCVLAGSVVPFKYDVVQVPQTAAEFIGLVSIVKQKYFQKTTKIHFYEKADPYFEFTNFYEEADAPVLLPASETDTVTKAWKTSEHYFQAMKYSPAHMHLVEKVRLLNTPREAFDFPRKEDKTIRKDWHKIKVGIMQSVVHAKFSQNVRLLELLLMTGNASLVEHTTKDDFWGDGANGETTGTGANTLGKTLMQVRANLQTANASFLEHFMPKKNLEADIDMKDVPKNQIPATNSCLDSAIQSTTTPATATPNPDSKETSQVTSTSPAQADRMDTSN